ncbi:MAG: DUF262 domain-containing HNH endonuclease family protein [bacterium]|nr:DUF262 domain-containing HNH endonuclease family protein [bacterium]
MKADTVELLGLFDRDIRFLVPIFQRNYKWNKEDHWNPLWDDIRGVAENILEFGEGPDLPDHFLGAIVCEQQQSFGRDAMALHVIDGQQRLTTLQLILAATRRVCSQRSMQDDVEYLDGLIENKVSVAKNRKAHKFKVWPNVADRTGYTEALENGNSDSRHQDAVSFFMNSISLWLDIGDLDDPLDDDEYSPAERMEALITAVTRHLRLVKIDLEPTDNAQLIFETLNGRGERLTDTDLIRNHLFRQADEEDVDTDAMHKRYWEPFDDPKWTANIAHGRHQRERIHMLINYWLSMRTLEEIAAGAIFSAFKRYVSKGRLRSEDIARDLFHYSEVFDSFENFAENSREWWFFRRLAEMDLITPYPVLLYLFGLNNSLPIERRRRAIIAIESFLVRRLIARDSTRSYGTIFIDVLQSAADGDPAFADTRIINSLANRSADTERWPTDDAIRHVALNTNVYKLKQSRLKMVLEAIERQLVEGGRAESITLGHNLWIEHLLPQTWNTVNEWSLPDGLEDPTRAGLERDHLLHTIGNLTLTTSRLDIEMANRPWTEKVDRLRQSVLNLNTDICTEYTYEWSEDTIRHRGSRLAEHIIEVWPSPQTLLDDLRD